MIPALHDFNEFLYGDKANEKKDVLHVDLLSKMQNYRPSGVRNWLQFGYFYHVLFSLNKFYSILSWITDSFWAESTSKVHPERGDEE